MLSLMIYSWSNSIPNDWNYGFNVFTIQVILNCNHFTESFNLAISL